MRGAKWSWCALLVLAALVLPAWSAEPHLTVATGTITGFDQQSSVLNVNTRLGPKLLLVTSSTVIFLNDRVSSTAVLAQAFGDDVEVEYRFDTSEVFFIRIFRESRLNGRAVSTDGTTLVFRRHGGGQANLRFDAVSRLRLGTIPVDDPSVLVGRRATAIVEPGTLLIIRYVAGADEFAGTVTAVDALNGTVTIEGKKKTRTFSLDEAATIRLNDEPAELADLAPGDHLRVAHFKSGPVLTAGALDARR